MSINSINEAFDRKFAAPTDSVLITDNDRLKQELLRVENSLERQGNYNLKAYEVAFQDVIERFFPDHSWWEVVDFDIFSDLFSNRNPIATVDNIISHIKKPAEVAPVVEAVDLTQKAGTIASVLNANIDKLYSYTTADSLRKAVIDILDNSDIADKKSVEKCKQILASKKSPAALLSTIGTYLTGLKTGTSKQKNEAVDSVVNATMDDFGSDEDFYDSPEYKIPHYELDLQELIDTMDELYNNGKVKNPEQYLAALSEAYNLIEDVETLE